MILRASVRLCHRTFGAVDARTSPFGIVETGLLARDIERALGCGAEEARITAHGAGWRMTTLETLARRPPRDAAAAIAAAAAAPAALAPLLALEENERPYILALPYTTGTVALLAHLIRRTRRTVVIEQTPLTQTLKSLFRCELTTPDALIRRNRTRGERGAREIFVTFPDHHLTLDGTTRPVTFLGGPFQFSLTELLLHVRGASPLVTLRADGGGYAFDSYDAAIDPAAVREHDALALLQWLAERLESVVRAAPATVLSWRSIAQRSAAADRTRRVLETRVLQALVRIGPLAQETQRWALERLRSIEESHREGDAA